MILWNAQTQFSNNCFLNNFNSTQILRTNDTMINYLRLHDKPSHKILNGLLNKAVWTFNALFPLIYKLLVLCRAN